MTPYQKRLTPMTKRMADDMKIRHLAQATVWASVLWVVMI